MNKPVLDVTRILKDYNLRAQKEYGQNFLQDPDILQRIADCAEIQPDETVLEIGPGLGTLTVYLAEQAKQVKCVEIDAGFVRVLKKTTAAYPNVQVILGDILQIDPATVAQSDDFLVVANVPYYITSAIFRHLLGASKKPKRIILTIQKEVAQRICNIHEEQSLLSLSIQIYGKPRILHRIPAEAFNPVPKVDSAVLRVDLFDQPVIPVDQIDAFFKLTKAGFSQKRKTLKNSLSATLQKKPAEIQDLLLSQQVDPNRRAETLSIEEWQRLIPLFAKQ